MSCRVVGAQVNRPLQFLFRNCPIPQPKHVYESNGGVSLAKALVDLKSFERLRLRVLPILKIECVRVCEADIGECVIRILRNRPLEIPHAQMSSFSGSLVQVELAGLVGFTSIDVRRFASRYWFPFIGVCLRR